MKMTVVRGINVICKKNLKEGEFELLPVEIFNYLELRLLSSNDMCVYLKLLRLYNHEYGYAYPSIKKLRLMTGIRSKTTIVKSLDNLERSGLISREKGIKGNNVYKVYKPLSQAELYRQVPELVKDLEDFKERLEYIDEQDKERHQQYKSKKEDNDLSIRGITNITPKAANGGQEKITDDILMPEEQDTLSKIDLLP
jgi:predicted transcriptional regulator